MRKTSSIKLSMYAENIPANTERTIIDICFSIITIFLVFLCLRLVVMNDCAAAKRLCFHKCEVNSFGDVFEERQAAA